MYSFEGLFGEGKGAGGWAEESDALSLPAPTKSPIVPHAGPKENIVMRQTDTMTEYWTLLRCRSVGLVFTCLELLFTFESPLTSCCVFWSLLNEDEKA